MKENKKIIVLAALVAGLIAPGVMPALAQDKPANNMQILREKVMADKKLLVAANMELTESEAKAFWPVYAKYQSLQIVEFACEHGRVTMGDVIRLTGASRNTLKQHFRAPVEQGHLNQHGRGRGVWYELL